MRFASVAVRNSGKLSFIAALTAGVISSAVAAPVVSQLDDPADLDLSLVQYALQFRNSAEGGAGPVSGVNFGVVSDTSAPAGVTASGGPPATKYDFDGPNWSGVSYAFGGGTANDEPLEQISSAGWSGTIDFADPNNPVDLPVNVGLALSPGTYKVQLIMVGTFDSPEFPKTPGNYTFEGVTTENVLTPGNYAGVAGADYTSLITETVTVTDGTLDLSIIWTGEGDPATDPDNPPTNAPILSGLIVNAIPEPASLSLLGLGGLGLLRRRARA